MTTSDTNRPSDFEIPGGPPPLVRETPPSAQVAPALTPTPVEVKTLSETEAFKAKLLQSRASLNVKLGQFSRGLISLILPENSDLLLDFKPTYATTNFERKAGTFVIPTPRGFFYYKVSTLEVGSHLLAFTVSPPVVTAGFYIKNKDAIYAVTPGDIKRNIVRLSRAVTLRRYLVTYESLLNGTGYVTPSGAKLSPRKDPVTGTTVLTALSETSQPTNDHLQQTVSGDLGALENEELKMVDLALREQVRTLYGVEDSEEGEWEISDTA